MSSLIGSFALDSAVALATQHALVEHISRRKATPAPLLMDMEMQIGKESTLPQRKITHNIRKITSIIFSASVHPTNFHLRCHLRFDPTTKNTKCDAPTCYQFNQLAGFCCEHSSALQNALLSELDISPIDSFPAGEFQDQGILEKFKSFSLISVDLMLLLNKLISISSQRGEPVVVQVTARSFSIIVDIIQYWCKEGRVFVRQWGDGWTCNCGSTNRCPHIMLAIYALHIRDPLGE